MLSRYLRFIFSATLISISEFALADIITLPTGLSGGDQYRLIFITSEFRDAISPNIAVYNSFVTQQANLNPALQSLGINWNAIGSTVTINARTNTNTGDSLGVPIYRLDGKPAFLSYDAMWGGRMENTISIDQYGSIRYATTLTGTAWAGTGSPNATLGASVTRMGFNDFLGGPRWVDSEFAVPSYATARFYGISGVLTIASVPEPSSLMMAVIALCGLHFRRFKRLAS